MAVQVTNYQCPACTAPLAYDGASGQLACEYCGSSFPVSEIEALNPGLDPARIKIGQELMLSGPVPYLSVQQTITESYVEAIPYETLLEYDDTMYKNKSKIKSTKMIEDVKKLLEVDKESWKAEIESIEAFYAKIGKYPEEMQKQIAILKKNILG